jgi:hypothetical protein
MWARARQGRQEGSVAHDPFERQAALGSPFSSASRNLAAELTSLMQDVIVDTTGALYAAGQRIVGPRLGLNGVVHIYESPPSSPCGVRPVLVGPGRGWAAFEPPLFSPLYGSPGVPAGSWRSPSFKRVRTKALARVAGARSKPPPRPFPGSHRRKRPLERPGRPWPPRLGEHAQRRG